MLDDNDRHDGLCHSAIVVVEILPCFSYRAFAQVLIPSQVWLLNMQSNDRILGLVCWQVSMNLVLDSQWDSQRHASIELASWEKADLCCQEMTYISSRSSICPEMQFAPRPKKQGLKSWAPKCQIKPWLRVKGTAIRCELNSSSSLISRNKFLSLYSTNAKHRPRSKPNSCSHSG